jgi:hypothetical protein
LRLYLDAVLKTLRENIVFVLRLFAEAPEQELSGKYGPNKRLFDSSSRFLMCGFPSSFMRASESPLA